MGRPSKLTEEQWAEVDRRVLAGESNRSIARDMGITEPRIRARVASHTTKIKKVAEQVVSAERNFEALPISSQITARNFAAELKLISQNLTRAAHHSAQTASRMSEIAASQAGKLDKEFPDSDLASQVAGFTKLANEASVIPFNLIKANQDSVDAMNKKDASRNTDDLAKALPDNAVDAAVTYAELIGK